jgi:hypothetical protein
MASVNAGTASIRLVHGAEEFEGDPIRLLEMKSYRDDPDNITTLMPIHDRVYPPEPERISKPVEDEMTSRARDGEVERLREQWQAKRGTIVQIFADLREIGFQERELWIMERRMARLDAKYPSDAA